jgi:hypothetical protein
MYIFGDVWKDNSPYVQNTLVAKNFSGDFFYIDNYDDDTPENRKSI